MGIKEEDLVRFLDEYMGNNGQYMKPKVNEDGEGTECITCADIPNITNYDVEE